MPTPSFWKKGSDTIERIVGKVSEFMLFSKSICPKLNEIARLEFELANYDDTAQNFTHYTCNTTNIRALSSNRFGYGWAFARYK